jgi:N-acetylmuramoyl-L-alanine amidase
VRDELREEIAQGRRLPVAISLVLVLSFADFAIAPEIVAAETSLAGRSVFLDPGHSGFSDASILRQVPNGRGGVKDCQTTGTSSNSGYPEHTFNWEVAALVQQGLEAQGIRTQLSRRNDNEIGPCIDQRAADANAMQPDAIVSIHADGAPPGGQGFHVNYSAPPLNPVQAGPSMEFAVTMRDALRSSGIREAQYIGAQGLLGRADLAGLNLYDYPGVLVELGNMRNAEDASRMESAEGRAAYAKAVVDGIVAYLVQTSTPR